MQTKQLEKPMAIGMFYRAIVWGLWPFLAIASCYVHAVDVSTPENVIPLQAGEGYLLLDLDINRDDVALTLDSKHIYALRRGKALLAYSLKAGKYHWESINVPDYDLPHRLALNKDDRWSFTIAENKLNYVGRVYVDAQRGMDSVGVQLVNRSATMLNEYHDAMIILLQRYPLTYGGSAKDDFLIFYQNVMHQEPHLGSP